MTRKAAERLKLKIEAVVTHAVLTESLVDPAKTPLDLKGSVNQAVDLGAPVVTFHLGGVPDGQNPDAAWKKTVGQIRAACDYGAARNVSVAVDGIWPEWLNDSMDAEESSDAPFGAVFVLIPMKSERRGGMACRQPGFSGFQTRAISVQWRTRFRHPARNAGTAPV